MTDDGKAVEKLILALNSIMKDARVLRGERRDEMARLLAIFITQCQILRGFLYTDIYLAEVKKLQPFDEVQDD